MRQSSRDNRKHDKHMATKALTVEASHCKEYLENAAKTLGVLPESALAMRFAVVQFILDESDVQDKAKRQAALKAFMALPGYMGSNNSAARQALWPEKKGEAKAGFDWNSIEA